MTEEEQREEMDRRYWQGFFRLKKEDPTRYCALILARKVLPSGREPDPELYLELAGKGEKQ